MKAAADDDEYQALIKHVHEGFPEERGALPTFLHPYWNVRDQLNIDNGLILKGTQIVIPQKLRQTVLTDLHAPHQGRDRTQRRARQIVYWPGISNDISNIVRTCTLCDERRDSQTKEPLMRDPPPELPFQSVSADLFSCQGRQYLVYSDNLSGWPCIVDLGHSTTSTNVIKPIRRWFADLGVPRKLVTDGGPQFTSKEFRQFCSRWQINHVRSTPHYPQANGHAEAAVKAVKNLIYKTTRNGNLDIDEFQRGLLEWRNTPRSSGFSPAQVVFGRPLSSFLFANHRSFAREHQTAANAADTAAEHLRFDTKEHYDKTSSPLPPLRIGTRVRIQDPITKLWSATGVVVAIGQRRDYYVKLPSGRVYWRNRRFLRIHYESIPTSTPPLDTSSTADSSHGTERPVHADLATQQPRLRRSQRERRTTDRLDISSTRCKSYQ